MKLWCWLFGHDYKPAIIPGRGWTHVCTYCGRCWPQFQSSPGGKVGSPACRVAGGPQLPRQSERNQ